MSGLLSVLGLLGLVVALVGVCRGSVRALGLATRSQCAKAAAAGFVVLLIGGAIAPDPGPGADLVAQEDPEEAAGGATSAPVGPEAVATSTATAAAAAVTAAPRAPAAVEPEQTPAAVAAPLLAMAAGGDGDSWRDTDGVEYRMGLVNAPEADECGGAAATAYRRRALADGFRATAYATDRYGRSVSVVVAADGVNLNVAMARDGIADDRYLGRFRHENPQLAAQLDAAFREARAARRGIWRTCGAATSGAAAGTDAARPAPAPPAPAPQPVAGGACHPDYTTCLPVMGDGSGRGAANDLDCADVNQTVHLRRIGRDPYRLDGNDRDGIGCE